jgi:hypothetical protein
VGTGDVLSGYTRPVTGGVGKRVIAVAALAHAVQAALGTAAQGLSMGSALFATELVLVPQQLTFQGPSFVLAASAPTPSAERPTSSQPPRPPEERLRSAPSPSAGTPSSEEPSSDEPSSTDSRTPDGGSPEGNR